MQEGLSYFVKVLWLCLLVIDINAPLKILDNISVIVSSKKYDIDASLSFHLVQAFVTAKGFIDVMTK